jgi:exopolysaccharide biosynthesis WecB/TagA/CpsF family protein
VQGVNDLKVEHVSVGGVPAAVVSEETLLDRMVDDCLKNRRGNAGRPTLVFDTNGHAISLYSTDPEYASAVDMADIVHADGQFVVFFSKLVGRQSVPVRTATTDLIYTAAQKAADHGLSFYLLGGSEDVNRACSERISNLYPRLRMAGRRDGYFSQAEEPDVVRDINDAGTDVLWVGLGKPREQVFCARNRERIECGWMVTCGGCFNFVVGDYARAPRWMQASGLEWLHRAATGPAYLKRRYLLTVPHAIWLAIADAVRERRGPQAGADRDG